VCPLVGVRSRGSSACLNSGASHRTLTGNGYNLPTSAVSMSLVSSTSPASSLLPRWPARSSSTGCAEGREPNGCCQQFAPRPGGDRWRRSITKLPSTNVRCSFLRFASHFEASPSHEPATSPGSEPHLSKFRKSLGIPHLYRTGHLIHETQPVATA